MYLKIVLIILVLNSFKISCVFIPSNVCHLGDPNNLNKGYGAYEKAIVRYRNGLGCCCQIDIDMQNNCMLMDCMNCSNNQFYKNNQFCCQKCNDYLTGPCININKKIN